MKHYMNLHVNPFERIKEGKKVIELRLNDEKRQVIKKGDIIEFVNDKTLEKIEVVVLNKAIYQSFEELYKHYDKISLGYLENEEASPNDMNQYYSNEKIEKYHVVAIHICLIENINPAILVDNGICPTCFDKNNNHLVYGNNEDKILYKDHLIECFLVGNPRCAGHVAISSIKHYKDMMEIDDDLCKHIFSFAKKMMNILKTVYQSESVYLCTMCDGPMNHFHIQLIPRYDFEKRGSKNFVKQRHLYIKDQEKISKIIKLLNFEGVE